MSKSLLTLSVFCQVCVMHSVCNIKFEYQKKLKRNNHFMMIKMSHFYISKTILVLGAVRVRAAIRLSLQLQVILSVHMYLSKIDLISILTTKFGVVSIVKSIKLGFFQCQLLSLVGVFELISVTCIYLFLS